MSDLKQNIQLTVRTVEGKRMVFDSQGNEIKGVIMTREFQDPEMARKGIVEVLIRVLANCE